MSVVTLQLGQCGNQIGTQFFSTISQDLAEKDLILDKKQNCDYVELSKETFFNVTDNSRSSGDNKNTSLSARAVMVDMEPKAIAQSVQVAKNSGIWKYPEQSHFWQKRGSGNNWAHGFCVHGPSARESVLELVRKQVEPCDIFGGFLNLMSLAGGTGSGVGTYLTRALRDEYPHTFVLNQVVWPYITGEVIVQNYNAILTLSNLYQDSDAILMIENDSIHKICSRLLNINTVSFKDINRVIAHKLAGILLPVYSSSGQLVHNQIGDILTHIACHPDFKLLTIRDIPQMSENSIKYSVFQWSGLLKHLRQMLIASSIMEEGIDWTVKLSPTNTNFERSLANLLYLRGKDIHQADSTPFLDSLLYPSWVPADCRVKVWSHPRQFRQYEKSASILSNSQAPIKPLGHVVDKAWSMFASRAYVHQYLNHGLTEEDFVDSFSSVEQMIASYKNL